MSLFLDGYTSFFFQKQKLETVLLNEFSPKKQRLVICLFSTVNVPIIIQVI